MSNNEGINQPSNNDQIESLRLILEREQERPFTYEEAQEVGESLIAFFEVLAEEIEVPALTTA